MAFPPPPPPPADPSGEAATESSHPSGQQIRPGKAATKSPPSEQIRHPPASRSVEKLWRPYCDPDGPSMTTARPGVDAQRPAHRPWRRAGRTHRAAGPQAGTHRRRWSWARAPSAAARRWAPVDTASRHPPTPGSYTGKWSPLPFSSRYLRFHWTKPESRCQRGWVSSSSVLSPLEGEGWRLPADDYTFRKCQPIK